jgi:YHS domain-containing protein
MKSPICPTCGCSLVRLGLGKDKAVAYGHKGEDYYFCCDGCLKLFLADPEKHLRETAGLIVCPVCLTEKPLNLAISMDHGGEVYHICRCPHCMDAFNKNPEYYIRRLRGEEDHPGIFGAACCPE